MSKPPSKFPSDALDLPPTKPIKPSRTRAFLAIAVVILAIALGTTVYAGFRAVAWVRDLPNRIDIDSQSIGQMFTESIRAGLHASDGETQRETLSSLAEGIQQSPEAASWVGDEFGGDIAALADSPDAGIAEAARALLAQLDSSAPPSGPPQTSGQTQ